VCVSGLTPAPACSFATGVCCQAFLRSVCVPDRAVEALTASDLRILHFNRSYVIVAGYLQHTLAKLQQVWDELAHTISRFCTKLQGKNRPALELAAATYVMRGVHDKLFLFLCKEHQQGDESLAQLMDLLAPSLTQVLRRDETSARFVFSSDERASPSFQSLPSCRRLHVPSLRPLSPPPGVCGTSSAGQAWHPS